LAGRLNRRITLVKNPPEKIVFFSEISALPKPRIHCTACLAFSPKLVESQVLRQKGGSSHTWCLHHRRHADQASTYVSSGGRCRHRRNCKEGGTSEPGDEGTGGSARAAIYARLIFGQSHAVAQPSSPLESRPMGVGRLIMNLGAKLIETRPEVNKLDRRPPIPWASILHRDASHTAGLASVSP